MTKTLKRPEVLSPAGTLEKLKVAVQYGADAVFIGGQAYGLRSRAGNFTFEQMEEGVQFAAKYGAKVYVAANMVMHEGNEEELVSGSVNCVISGLQQLSYLTQL